MKILLINNVEDTSIDSAIVFENLRTVLSKEHDVKLVNHKMAAKTVNMQIPEEYYRYSILDRNVVMSKYIKQYEKLFGLDLIIAADCSFIGEDLKVPVISYMRTPFSDISKISFDNKYYNTDEHLEFGYCFRDIQKCQVDTSREVIATDKYMQHYVGDLGYLPSIVPFGIDTEKYKQLTPVEKNKLREKYNIPLDKKIGIWCGFFHGLYGFHFVKDLINEFKDIFWICAMKTETGYRPKQDNVKLILYDENIMPELFNCADFYINPSYLSSIDLRAVEAMACNIPIINSKTGMFFDWSSGDCGKIVVNQKYEDYKEAVETVIKKEYVNPRSVMIEEGFDIYSFGKKWLDIVKKYNKGKV